MDGLVFQLCVWAVWVVLFCVFYLTWAANVAQCRQPCYAWCACYITCYMKGSGVSACLLACLLGRGAEACTCC
jgi:hypothetical protein